MIKRPGLPISVLVILAVGFLVSANCSKLLAQSAVAEDYSVIANLPPITVTAQDVPDDNGNHIQVNWVDSGYGELPEFTSYEVLRRNVATGAVDTVGRVDRATYDFEDDHAKTGETFTYQIVAVLGDRRLASGESAPVQSVRQWFKKSKTSVVVIGLIICGAVILFIETAKRGRRLFLRQIAGLQAIDEAVGRATEMGRPVLFVAGTQDMDNVQTLAGLTLLSRVARTIAQYDSKINMPCRASLVMTAGREIIKEAYAAAGRPDGYSDDMVHYTTDEQFGFVAATNGIMVRERPATCFYLGAFFAESLILAETGNSIEAIQIAGTAMPAQLPFFVAACDYTLIGEELFAASAYLSEEPKQLGSLKGQDVGKAIAMVAILVGTTVATIGQAWDIGSMQRLEEWMHRIFSIN